jgi:hypothetical protein
MTVSLQRLDQLHKPDTFDDTRSAASVAGSEAGDVDFADHINAVLSQIKRTFYGDNAGNWHDDPATIGPGSSSVALTALGNKGYTDDKNILAYRLNLTDITVPASQNYVVLSTAGWPPDRDIAFGASSIGAVCAQLAGGVGSHDLTEQAGSNPLRPKNIVQIFDGATGDPITSSGRRVYALLQVGNLATDGNAFALAGNDQGQYSFVRPNATYDDLEACPVADIENQVIVAAFTERNTLADMPEESFRGDLESADPGAGVGTSLDDAYNGGEFITVDAGDLDWRFADTKGITMRKGAGGVILFEVRRTDAGSADLVKVGADVDLFDVDAADNDFLQGVKVDTGDQTINLGITALGVIDSTSIETRATTGNNEVSAPSGDVQFQTVRETTAIPLDDATAGPISALSGGPYASVAAAIKGALDGAGGAVSLAFDTYVAAGNFSQGVNIPGVTLDLTAYTLDANTPANTDLFLFLNGRLLFGGNGTTKNDVYAGDTPASGDIKVDFSKGIKTGDVILSIGLQ